jgi:hypothetical protein
MRRLFPLLTVAVVLALAGCGSSSSSSSSSSGGAGSSTSSTSSSSATSSKAQTGFEGVPIESGANVASPSTTGTSPVNGISCGATEQLAYHIHAHLAVFVNGQSRAVPGGIGIPGSQIVQSSEGPVANGGECIYWLHTHAPDGVIHIESPTKRIYTLGDFFGIWRQPLSSNDVAGVKGKVSAIVNGKPWTKSLSSIPLDAHNIIQLNIGSPAAPFQSVDWSQTQL